MQNKIRLTLASLTFTAAMVGLSAAQEPAPAPADDDKPAFQRRLPAYYADVVTEQQRAKIYAIQKEYFAKMQPLHKQIFELQKEERAAIRALLTPEQRDTIAKKIEEAKKRRELVSKLTPEQRRAAAEAARKAYLEALKKAQAEAENGNEKGAP